MTQLSNPAAVVVDQSDQIYVTDRDNHRIMWWSEREKQGTIVLGGNGEGRQKNQFSFPIGFSFDGEENFHVADCKNHQIEKFDRNF